MSTQAVPERPPIGRNLRSLMKQHGMTRAELARRLETTERQVYHWIGPEGRTPGWDTVRKLAVIFDKTPAWFYEEHPA